MESLQKVTGTMGETHTKNVLQYQGWDLLPDVALVQIYSYLEDMDRSRMARVCKNWCRMFSYPSLWRYRRIRFGGYGANGTGQNAWKFAKLFAKHLRSLALSFGLPSFRTVKIMSKAAEAFLRKLGSLTNLKIQYITLEYLNMEHYWHFILSRNRIVTSLARFLKRQRHLTSISMIGSRLTLIDGCRILESMGRGAAGRMLDTIYMEDMFQANILPFRHRRYVNALKKFTGLQYIHTNYTYLNEEVLGLFAKNLGKNLQRMTVMIDTDVSANIISNGQWNEFVTACPSLKVAIFVCSSALRGDIYSALVRGIPLFAIHLSIWKAMTDGNPHLISNLLDYVANNYHKTLESLALHLDRNPNIDENLLNFLKKCRQLRELSLSGMISVPTVETICKLQEEGKIGKLSIMQPVGKVISSDGLALARVYGLLRAIRVDDVEVDFKQELLHLNLSIHGLHIEEYEYMMTIRGRLRSAISRNAVIIETNIYQPNPTVIESSSDSDMRPDLESDSESSSAEEEHEL